jgi:hypothetical protein
MNILFCYHLFVIYSNDDGLPVPFLLVYMENRFCDTSVVIFRSKNHYHYHHYHHCYHYIIIVILIITILIITILTITIIITYSDAVESEAILNMANGIDERAPLTTKNMFGTF